MRSSFLVVPAALVFFSVMLGGCGDHGGVGRDELVTVSGVATLPASVAGSKQYAANSIYQVLDLARAPAQQLIAQGVTDSSGGYSVEMPPTKLVAVVVTDLVRVSGLISADPSAQRDNFLFQKGFDGATDVACEAGVTAVVEGAVEATAFSSERIANLEAAAALIVDQVNFLDPASVTAAAAQVRQMTSDGANPPVR